MSHFLPFHVYDVFSDRAYAGNPLAIVEQAEGLSDAQMLAMARQFNLSETIFVMPPRDPAHSARVRIWFPTAEIPFAGHPTLGCAVHLSAQAFADGAESVRIVLEEEAGLVPVDLRRTETGVEGWFTAPILPFAGDGTIREDLIGPALGLEAAALGLPGHLPCVWHGGPAFLYLPVRDLAALAEARPCEPAWSELLEAAGVDSAYVYAPGEEGVAWQARMFSPTAGIPEDPATGSASAILAAQLLAAGVLPDGETRLMLAQGVEMGRPSRLGLLATVENGALAQIRVGGQAVPVSDGRIRPPA